MGELITGILRYFFFFSKFSTLLLVTRFLAGPGGGDFRARAHVFRRNRQRSLDYCECPNYNVSLNSDPCPPLHKYSSYLVTAYCRHLKLNVNVSFSISSSRDLKVENLLLDDDYNIKIIGNLY